MVLTLISATPSPFARMNRITLLEKNIPFTLKNEIPWHAATETPKYNPLEKLPVLIFDDDRAPIYDSAYIQEYLVQKYAGTGPSLLPGTLDADLRARQIQTLAEGVLDAFVLIFFEKDREQPSEPWMARQNRKLDGAMRAFDELARNRQPRDSDFLLADKLTIADIAVCCAIGQVTFGELRPRWKEDYPELAKYWMKLDERESFRSTRPVMFDLSEKIV